ncbi:hypothetical protein LX32DRAFT_281132 [Colletotrichum zoysiae]|uniref:Uncharacterized protein n=1 Tax=Colletotrichum zoysiae TaxID=1216348 RepID=A0AAD9LUK7_9PEZI|nr:hypothetical protein LX32DRAFT_281132 [Colletotrichum zoysiae]
MGRGRAERKRLPGFHRVPARARKHVRREKRAPTHARTHIVVVREERAPRTGLTPWDGDPDAAGLTRPDTMLNHSVLGRPINGHTTTKPSRSCPTSGLPYPARFLQRRCLSVLSRRTPCRCFPPPCSIFFSLPRVTSVLYATPKSSVLSTALFSLLVFFRLGQALLLRAQVSMGLSIIPQYPLRAPSSPSVPFNASLRALFRGLLRAPHAITSCSVLWGAQELGFFCSSPAYRGTANGGPRDHRLR